LFVKVPVKRRWQSIFLGLKATAKDVRKAWSNCSYPVIKVSISVADLREGGYKKKIGRKLSFLPNKTLKYEPD